MDKKTCTKCKESKPLEEFAWRYRVKGTRNAWCKLCHRRVNNKLYKDGNRKAQVVAANRICKLRNRKFLDEYKIVKGCKHCGYRVHPAALDFHHRDGIRKDRDVASLSHSLCSIARLEREILKCDVLCACCHRVLHFEEKAHSSTG